MQLNLLADQAAEQPQGNGVLQIVIMVAYIAIIGLVFYFLLIRHFLLYRYFLKQQP